MPENTIVPSVSSGVRLIKLYSGAVGTTVPPGTLIHKGSFDASGGTPPSLISGMGAVYTVTVAGTVSGITYASGDFIINDGDVNTPWYRIVGTPRIDSVNGMTGIVVLDKSDVGLGNADNTSDADKPVSTIQATINNTAQNRSIDTPINSGLKGGGDLTEDRSIELDIDNTVAVSVTASSDALLIQTGSGVRRITRDNLLAGVAGGLKIQGEAGPRTGNTNVINVSGDSSNTTITQGTAPAHTGTSPDGLAFICILLAADKNTGITLPFGGPTGTPVSITINDQDQLVWTGDRWTHLETGNNVSSVFGRSGVVEASSGDYNASQVTSEGGSNVQADIDELTQADTDEATTRANKDTLIEGRLDVIEPVITSNTSRLDNNEVTSLIPSEAQFNRECQHVRDGSAGSGFKHMGKHSVAANIVNEGLWATSTIANRLIMGRAHTGATGSSLSDVPVAEVNGVLHKLELIGAGSDLVYNINNINLPPAPDGTKTFNKITGKVTQHASSAEAFEGLLLNGDFRNGGTEWTVNDAVWSVVDGVATMQVSNTFQALRTNYLNFIIGSQYKLEFSVLSINLKCKIVVDMDADLEFVYEGTGSKSFVFTATSDSAYIHFVRQENGASMSISSVSVMPVGESVITSRQDYGMIESFHEVISGAGGVFHPNGNVAYGAYAWNGITLSDTLKPQTYSAFGEWDTVTTGYGVLWDSLSDADKHKIIEDPYSNVYRTIDGKVVQVKFRPRIIEGLGDEWIRPFPTFEKNTALNYSSKAYIQARGIKSGVLSDLSYGTQDVFFTTGNSSWPDSLGKQKGLGSVKVGRRLGYKDLCFAIPLFLVQRRNQGAYHKTHNPEGCGSPATLNGGFTTHYLNDGALTLNSRAECFRKVSAATNTGLSGVHVYSGYLSLNRSGRDDGKFYDGILASDVQDLRMHTAKRVKSEVLAEYDLKAKAATIRGFEGVPFTKFLPNMVAGTGIHGNSALLWSIDATNVYYFSEQPNDVPIGSRFRVVDIAAGLDMVGFVNTNPNTSYVRLTLSTSTYNSYPSTPSGVGHEGSVFGMLESLQLHKSAEPTWTDIIGDPTEILATFPDGVEGTWVPKIPDGVVSSYSATRKIQGAVSRVRSSDNGGTWVSGVTSVDAVGNILLTNEGTNTIGLHSYKTKAHFMEDAPNSKILSLGNVWGSARHDIFWGGLLISNLIGKVPVSDNTMGNQQLPLQSYTLNNTSGGLVFLHPSQPKHNMLDGIGNTESPAAKTLSYLSETNGVLGLDYLYKEMIYDNTADSGLDSTIVVAGTTHTIAVGEMVKFEGFTVVPNTNYFRRVSEVIGRSIDDAYLDGLESDSAGNITLNGIIYWEKWDGNGWGDDGKFNSGTSVTDDNGSLCKVGNMKVKLPYFNH